jgi:hypothetical protein
MIYTLFQYKVKPDRVGAVQDAINRQIEAIETDFGHAVQLKVLSSLDNLSYVHLATIQDEETFEQYKNSELLEKFITVLHENCETFSQLKELKFVRSTGN